MMVESKDNQEMQANAALIDPPAVPVGPVESASSRLEAICRQAVRNNPGNFYLAKQHVINAVRGDAELLLELFAPFREMALQRALSAAVAADRHVAPASASVAASGAGLRPSENRSSFARPTPATRPISFPRHPTPAVRPTYRAPSPAAMGAVVATVRRSLLDTFVINGQPIGDVTAREASAWASSKERDSKFVRLLVENLPPDQPIRKYRTDDDAASLYAKAGGSHE